MKDKKVTQKKPKRITIARLILTITNGVILGFLMSFILSCKHWLTDDYEHELMRLNMTTAIEDNLLDKFYQSPVAAWAESMTMSASNSLSITPINLLHSDFSETNTSKKTQQKIKGGQLNTLVNSKQFKQFINHGQTIGYQFKTIFMANALIIVKKLILLLLSLPLLVLAAILGIIDGLTQREIRRYEYGRESSLIFHKMIDLVPRFIFLTITIFLITPLTFNLLASFAIGALVTFLIAANTVSRFKKYA